MLREMYHLYHRPPAGRPIRVAWTLEEIGVDWELTLLDSSSINSEEHRARQPLGRVPALDLGDGFIFESAAACLQLADLNPDAGLIPAVGTYERGLVYQWSVFPPAELEPPLIEASFRAGEDTQRRKEAFARFVEARGAVERALANRAYLVGEQLTIADVMVGTTLAWVIKAGQAETLPANLRAYTERLIERPAFERAQSRLTAEPAAAA
jgi:glutathione S-transferase